MHSRRVVQRFVRSILQPYLHFMTSLWCAQFIIRLKTNKKTICWSKSCFWVFSTIWSFETLSKSANLTLQKTSKSNLLFPWSTRIWICLKNISRSVLPRRTCDTIRTDKQAIAIHFWAPYFAKNSLHIFSHKSFANIYRSCHILFRFIYHIH